MVNQKRHRRGAALSGRRLRNNGEAQSLSIAFKRLDLAITNLIVISLSITGFERGFVAKHVEDDDGELVSGGNNGLGLADLGAHAALISTKRGIGTQQRDCGKPKGMRDAIGPLANMIAQNLAARFFVVRGKAQPGREMIGRRELMHVAADFGQNNLNGGGAEAIDFKQINSSDAAKMGLRGLRRRILAVSIFASFVRGGGRSYGRVIGMQRGEIAFNLSIADSEMSREKRSKDGATDWRKMKEIFITPGAGKGFGDIFFR